MGSNGLFRQGSVLGGAAGSGYTPLVFSFVCGQSLGFTVTVRPTGGGTIGGGVTYIAPSNVVTPYKL